VCALVCAWLPIAPTRAQAPSAAADQPAVSETVPPALPPVLEPLLAGAPAPVTPLRDKAAQVSPLLAEPAVGAPAPIAAAAEDEAAAFNVKWAKASAAKAAPAPVDPADPAMMKELQVARAQVKDLAQQLEVAQRRLMELEARQAAGRRTTVSVTQDGVRKVIEIDTRTGKIIQETVVGKGDPNAPTMSGKMPSSTAAGTYSGNEWVKNKARTSSASSFAGDGSRFDKGGPTREQRLNQIESNLKALLDEVRAIRAETDRKADPEGFPNPNKK
jgi:hypothetical protein